MGKRKSSDVVRVLVGTNDTSAAKDISSLLTETESKEKTKEETIEVDIGLDISTSVVGICVLEAKTGKMLYLGHVKLTKYDNEYDKADNFPREWLDPSWKVKRVFIEEAAKKFSPGFSSADTIMTLGRFNGILSYKIYSWTSVKPKMVNVRSARSKLQIKIDYKDKTKNTKDKVFEKVRLSNPSFPWVQHVAKTGKHKGELVYDTTNCDMADAYVICRGGQILGV